MSIIFMVIDGLELIITVGANCLEGTVETV